MNCSNGDFPRKCDQCDRTVQSAKPNHTECRRCWALPLLMLRAQRYMGAATRPLEECSPDAIQSALELLDAVAGQERGGVDA